jgi:hypothetical protein
VLTALCACPSASEPTRSPVSGPAPAGGNVGAPAARIAERPQAARAKATSVDDSEPWKVVDPASDGNDICADDMSYDRRCSSNDPTLICRVDLRPARTLKVTVCHAIDGYWALQHDVCNAHVHITLGEFNRRFVCERQTPSASSP